MILSAALLAITAQASACVPIEQTHITGAELAKADSFFSAVPAARIIGYAPLPGHRRVFSLQELARIAQREGITGRPEHEICFDWPVEQLKSSAALEAMRQSLPEAQIEVLELSRYPAPRGRMQFRRSDLQKGRTGPLLWRGRVEYGSGQVFHIWAKVKVTVSLQVVVAAVDLRAGKIVQPEDLKMEQYEGIPFQQPPATSISDVLGRLPRSLIRAGSLLHVNSFETAKDVLKGDLVRVEARMGAAHISIQARAQSSGRRGESIPFKNESSGKVFRATIDSPGLAVVGGQEQHK